MPDPDTVLETDALVAVALQDEDDVAVLNADFEVSGEGIKVDAGEARSEIVKLLVGTAPQTAAGVLGGDVQAINQHINLVILGPAAVVEPDSAPGTGYSKPNDRSPSS